MLFNVIYLHFLPGILRYRVDFQSMEMDGEFNGNDFGDSDDEDY